MNLIKRFLTILTILLFSAYAVYVVYRAHWSYNFLKLNKYGLSHSLFEIDEELGYCLKPNSSGFQYFPVGGPFPVKVDNHGFRSGQLQIENSADFITLGDSHVFADGCSADSSFGQVASAMLNVPVGNAGISGYGYVQVNLLLERLMEKNQPKAIILFCSPWLAERSISWYAPTYNGTVPVPYVYETASGELAIRKPLYKARLPKVDEKALRSSEASFMEFIGFLKDTWWDLYVRADVLNTIIKLKMMLGIIPGPHENQNKAESFLFKKIKERIEDNDVDLIALNMSHDKDYDEQLIIEIFGEANVIDLDPILWNGVKEGASSEEYFRKYAFVNGNPQEVVDYHLNCDVHQFIGDTLATYLSQRYYSVDTAGVLSVQSN